MAQTLTKKKRRQMRILTELQLYPQIKVSELAYRLNVSQETIRRDLAGLQEAGQIERTFGGAVSSSIAVPSVSERQHLMNAERDRISEAAVGLIEPNDVIMVGGGSTTLRFALQLTAIDFPLTVVTHSLPFASSVGKNKRISVEFLPGRLNPDEGLTFGTRTISAIQEYKAHKAFVGTAGVTEDGLYSLVEPGEVYKALIAAARKAFILSDSSKYGSFALSRYQRWQPGMTLVTDALPDRALQDDLERQGVTFMLG